MRLTVYMIRSSTSQMNPNAMKSLITFSMLLDCTMMKMHEHSVRTPADIFINATKNGKNDYLP